MRIGIDFDNTIACYDGVFHAAAVERGLIPQSVGIDKNSVRDFLNASGGKDAFTVLQGHVYGSRMDLASPFPGVEAFVRRALGDGHALYVVSHKTRHPMLGEKHDMHEAARWFLRHQDLVGDGDGLIPLGNVYFEQTKTDKIDRAASLQVDAFIDDLPEILAMSGLPDHTRRILFDPAGQHQDKEGIERAESWAGLTKLLLTVEPRK